MLQAIVVGGLHLHWVLLFKLQPDFQANPVNYSKALASAPSAAAGLGTASIGVMARHSKTQPRLPRFHQPERAHATCRTHVSTGL